MPNISSIGRLITIRDNTGFCTTNSSIILSTTAGATFAGPTVTGSQSNRLTINQPFGFLTLSMAANGQYNLINTFAFSSGQSAAVVSQLTTSNVLLDDLASTRFWPLYASNTNLYFISTPVGQVTNASLQSTVNGLGQLGYLSSLFPPVQNIMVATGPTSTIAVYGVRNPTGTIQYSLNGGFNWYTANGGFYTGGYDVTYANNLFVACGDNNAGVGGFTTGHIQYSVDGQSWLNGSISLPFDAARRRVRYLNGLWHCVGADPNIGLASNLLWSPDGINWNPSVTNTFSNAEGLGIAHGAGVWVVALWGAPSAPKSLMWSSDGSNWNDALTVSWTQGYCSDVDFDGTRFVAMVGSGVNPAASNLATSLDGKNWTSAGMTGGNFNPGVSVYGYLANGVSSCVCGTTQQNTTRIVVPYPDGAVGFGQTLKRSFDGGLTWQSNTDPSVNQTGQYKITRPYWDGNKWWAGYQFNPVASCNQAIYYSLDNGVTFKNTGITGGFSNGGYPQGFAATPGIQQDYGFQLQSTVFGLSQSFTTQQLTVSSIRYTSESVAIGSYAGQSNQDQGTVAIGSGAGKINQGLAAIAIGPSAGNQYQSSFSIAIGIQAGEINQDSNNVAIGYLAGNNFQNANSIAIGSLAGYFAQSTQSIAIGLGAGTIQNINSVAIGTYAGSNTQGSSAIAIGDSAGGVNQGSVSLAIGRGAGQSNQSNFSIAIGNSAGSSNQQDSCVAIGNGAGAISQSTGTVAIGWIAGNTGQQPFAVGVGFQSGATNQNANAVAIGNTAGYTNQSTNAISIGYQSGFTGQRNDAIAIGNSAGGYLQRSVAIAIGTNAGYNSQGLGSVAIGSNAGTSIQGQQAVAIGFGAGESSQGNYAVAVGLQAGSTQATNAVAVGNNAGFTSQGTNSVAVGAYAGNTNQGGNSVAIGNRAGGSNQSTNAIAIGNICAYTNQGEFAIAMGVIAGQSTQGAYSIAIGCAAGQSNQQNSCVAIGNTAGLFNQGNSAVAMGYRAGSNQQGNYCVAIGLDTGVTGQLSNSVAIGNAAGFSAQKQESVAIGVYAGTSNQGYSSVAIGRIAGSNNQGSESVAIGNGAGGSNQSTNAIAIGNTCGITNQGAYAIAIGTSAGNTNQGNYSIAIGKEAGSINQHTSTIILNATGNQLQSVVPTSFYVKPVRNATLFGTQMNYDSSSGEITYGTPASDSNLKDEIQTARSYIDELEQVRLVTYRIKGRESKRYLGVIAQEVQEIFPTATTLNEDGYLSLDPTMFTYLNTNAIQSLYSTQKALVSQVQSLTADVSTLLGLKA